MPDAPLPLPPGSMTVPVWFGWESVAAVVTLLLVAGLVFLLASASRSGSVRRDEWQALLEARSARAGALLDDEPAGTRQPGDVPSR